MNFVVFGSLARREWTSGSDVDWSLLVDGQTDPEDIYIAKRIEQLLIANSWQKPSPSGVFGSLAFSHSLVHDIGGSSDSHVNTTRRVLLLLESRGVANDGSVRDRIIRALLGRYLEEDTHFHPENGSRSFVPRFLLNDVVRYWRTIAVDYANKTREVQQTKWALRNIKLRMSRKLIFVNGLLMCFLCHLNQERIQEEPTIGSDDDPSNMPFINYLADLIEQTPLDLLADVVSERKISDDTIRLIFDSYNQFLEALNDPAQRKHLEGLTYKRAKIDETFERLRKGGKAFQEGLRRLFFEENEDLRKLCQVYGLF